MLICVSFWGVEYFGQICAYTYETETQGNGYTAC